MYWHTPSAKHRLLDAMRTAGFIACVLFCSSALLAQSSDARETYRKLREEFQRAYKAKDYPALIDANKRALEFTHGNSRWLLNLAGCYALAGRQDEAFRALRRLADMKIDGSEIAKDDDFASLKADPRWKTILEQFSRNAAPFGVSETVAKFDDPGLLTEDITSSARTRTFYLTSVREKKILRIANRREITILADLSSDHGWPLMAIVADPSRDVLWVTAAAMPDFEPAPKLDWGRSALLEVSLETGKVRNRYDLPQDGSPHVLGDAALMPNGDLILSDGRSGAVYRFHNGTFTRIDAGEFISPQTPAISPDGVIIVPDYVRGLALVAPDSSKPVTWIASAVQALNGIDGLYFVPPSRNAKRDEPILYAIQNGISPQRILAIRLANKMYAVKSTDNLLSNTPGLGELTHGVFQDSTFYFIANSGWDQLDDSGKPKAEVKPTPPEVRELHDGSASLPTLRRRDVK